MKVLGLAEYVIRRATEKEVTITNLKLQKTLYYLQGYTLRCFEEPAFEEQIQNWQYGPVVPTAYFAYSSYGASPLEMNTDIMIETIGSEREKFYNKIIDACLKYTARELVQKTHQEDPWKKSKLNEEITKDNLMKFFCASNPLNLEN